MKTAILTTVATTLVLILILTLVGQSQSWPPVEDPPRQGEALDPAAYKDGIAVHSAKSLAQLIREPQNTWSNLAFIFAGALLVSRGTSRCARLTGLMLIFVGLGSFLYHASASRTWRNVDVAGMYGLYFVAVIFCLGTWWRSIHPEIEKHAWLVAISAVIFAAGATVGRNFAIFGFKPFALALITGIVAAILTITLLLAAKHNPTRRTFGMIAVTILFFIIAVVCQVGDRPGNLFCNPESLIQAHALWHLFSAAAFAIAVGIIDAVPSPAASSKGSSLNLKNIRA